MFPLAQKRKVFSISARFATDCYNNSMVIVQSGCSRLYTLQPSKSVPLSHLTHLSAGETRHEEDLAGDVQQVKAAEWLLVEEGADGRHRRLCHEQTELPLRC